MNQVRRDHLVQALQILLGDIALTDANLCELRQFRPQEVVRVEFTPHRGCSRTTPGPSPGGGRRRPRRAPEPKVEDLLVEEEDSV